MPAFAAWIASPIPGASSTTVVSAVRGDLDLGLPDSDGLHQDDVAAGGVEHPQRLRCRPGQPAEVPAAGHRPDVDVPVERVVLHPDPVTEQRAAGERGRRVDGQHTDPLAARPEGSHQRVGRRRLADARGAGETDDGGPPAVRRQGRHRLAQHRRRVLDQRDQPRHRPRVTVAGARDEVVDVRRGCHPVSGRPGRAAPGRRPGRRRRTVPPRRHRRRGAAARGRGAARSGRRTCRSGGRARSPRRSR